MSSSGVTEIETGPAPTDWPCPRNQIALATDTAENQPTEVSGAATQPMSAGSTTTDHVPIAARAPARSAAGIAVEGLTDGVVAAVVVVVLGGASGLTPALRAGDRVRRSVPSSQDPRRGASAHAGGGRPGWLSGTDQRNHPPAAPAERTLTVKGGNHHEQQDPPPPDASARSTRARRSTGRSGLQPCPGVTAR